MKPTIIKFSEEKIQSLKRSFENFNEVTLFNENLKLSSIIASYGIFREVGTLNDELARFIFDATTKKPLRLESLKANFIEWNGLFGLQIFSTDTKHLELRTKGLYDMIHPNLSKNDDRTIHSLYIFPEIINAIAQSEGVELVLVKSWGMNSIFGGFDPMKAYYQTNFWELENNDSLKFSDLIRHGRLAFMGTHDLVAHIAGLDQKQWYLLRQEAQKVYETIHTYFKSVTTPSISTLILPYTAGVILDDLAQPPSYASKNHIAVLNELIKKISTHEIPANLSTFLTQFPNEFKEIIDMSRKQGIERNPSEIKTKVNSFVQQILSASLINPFETNAKDSQ